MRLQAAELQMWKAAALYDAGKPCGIEAKPAKYLAAEASFETALRAVRTHGGFGFAKEYHVERGLRESVRRCSRRSRRSSLCASSPSGPGIAEVILTGAPQDGRIDGLAEASPSTSTGSWEGTT